MIKSALLLVFVIFGASSVANAACEKGTKTVFRCLAASGKQIQVCDSGRTIDYSFGKPGLPPEIIVRAPRTEAYTIPWNGMGRYESYSVAIPNGNTTYDVFWSEDRITEGRPVSAGVNVQVSKKHVATVRCVGEKHIVQKIVDTDLKSIE